MFTFIDLFAGIGGIRQGFEANGGQCVFSSEWDKYAQQSYEANYGEVPHGDITQISVADIPSHDVLAAGFPCQPFSNAGLRKGFEDTRGTLFFDIARIIEAHKPALVLLENVKGLKTHDKGNTFKVIAQTLEGLGYEVHAKVLSSNDFGVPQNRERIYIVAVNREKTNANAFNYPEATGIVTRLGNILEPTVDSKYTMSDRLWGSLQAHAERHKANGNGFSYNLFTEATEYTTAIVARYYKDGSNILIKQDGSPRRLTPREAARLQGFPESYKIVVSDTQAYKQFGNSVAVPVITAIANNMVSLLKENL